MEQVDSEETCVKVRDPRPDGPTPATRVLDSRVTAEVVTAEVVMAEVVTAEVVKDSVENCYSRLSQDVVLARTFVLQVDCCVSK